MSLIIYAVTCSPVQSKINVAAARKYRRHRCETQLYTSFAVASVTSTKNQYFPPTWNILSAVSDEFSISILSTRLITVPKKEKKKGGGRNWRICSRYHRVDLCTGTPDFANIFILNTVKVNEVLLPRGSLAALPETYIEFRSMWARGQPVFLVRISLGRVTPPRGPTWFLGDRESRISFDHWPTSKIVLRIILRNWENDADTRDLPHV